MLSEDTADCLALANTAILMRLIEKLIECDVVARPAASDLLTAATHDLESCPEFSTRVEDAIKMIRKELMPRIAGTTASYWLLVEPVSSLLPV